MIQLHQTPAPTATTLPFPSQVPLTLTQSSSKSWPPVPSCPYSPSPATQISPSAVSATTCPDPTPTSITSTPPLMSTNWTSSSSAGLGRALTLFLSPACPPQMYKSLSSLTAAPTQPPTAVLRIGIPPKNVTGHGLSAGAAGVGVRPSVCGCNAEPNVSTSPVEVRAVKPVAEARRETRGPKMG